jgi:HlyD family secretion protein
LRREIEAAELVVLQSEEGLRRDTETRRVETERKRLSLSMVQRDLESYRTESQLQLQEAEASVARAERELRDGEELLQAKAISAEAVRAKREKAEDARRAREQRRVSIAAGLASREKAVAQAQLDAGTQSVSEKSLQAARLGISKAQAELAERRRKLADTRVVAPIGGTIHIISRTRSSSMSASGPSSEVLGPGVRVFEGDPFLEIATTERACVRIDVDETDIGRLTRGTRATVTGDAFPGVRLKGEVTEIQTSGKKAGQGVSLFPVTVLITSPLRGVHMGMTADVGLALGARETGGRR